MVPLIFVTTSPPFLFQLLKEKYSGDQGKLFLERGPTAPVCSCTPLNFEPLLEGGCTLGPVLRLSFGV